jgi:hypothetical protein
MNFNEQAFVERLLTAEQKIVDLTSGQEQLLKKLTQVKKENNKGKTPKELCEVAPKILLCKRILFYIKVLECDFEKELAFLKIEGGYWSGFGEVEEDIDNIVSLAASFYEDD